MQTVTETKIESTQISGTYDTPKHLLRLWLAATNYDFDNPIDLYKRYISFIKDQTFNKFDELTTIGTIDDDNYIKIQRVAEYFGYETPYKFNIFLCRKDNEDIKIQLPSIRYGIEQGKDGKKLLIFMQFKELEKIRIFKQMTILY